MSVKREKNSKRGQITIFVIIALAIIGVLAIAFFPQIKKLVIPPTPVESIPRECIQSSVAASLNTSLFHGGSLNPQLYFRYENSSVAYLCYTSEWYKTCTMQKPLLKQDIESEITAATQSKIGKCLNDMETALKNRGYDVKVTGNKNAIVSIIPDKVLVSFNFTMALNKGEEKIILAPGNFQTEFSSKAYQLIMITTSILNWEARFGDTATESWMQLYPDIKIQKLTQSDGTKVYLTSNRNSGEELRFATRSLAWPPGLPLK